MRVQLASPELHKHLRFLSSSSSIKEKKQEIPESHWLKPWLFTTAPLLLCPIQMYTSCMTTFNLRTPHNTQATLIDRDSEFYSLLKQWGSSPAQGSGTGATGWEVKEGGGGRRSGNEWIIKRLRGDLWTGPLPRAFVLTTHGGTGVALNTGYSSQTHLKGGGHFNQHLLHLWIIEVCSGRKYLSTFTQVLYLLLLHNNSETCS